MLHANDAKLIHGASSYHSAEWTEAFERDASFKIPDAYVEMLDKYRARVHVLMEN